MDALPPSTSSTIPTLQSIDLHTCGEPARVIYKGWPEMAGATLLEQRREGMGRWDWLRAGVLREPRGHGDMYGALIRPTTELTATGAADMGVLFQTNTSWSTMCGHATIALGRFLVDTHDLSVFPRRDSLPYDSATDTVALRLHAPCGLLNVTVPTVPGGRKSDSKRRVSFVGTPSYAAAVGVRIAVPEGLRWPELKGRGEMVVDFAFGGTFFAVVEAAGVGWEEGLRKPDLERLKDVARMLKELINEDKSLCERLFQSAPEDLRFLYSVMFVDPTLGTAESGTAGAETGICFFGDQQLDRSPTGSSVMARVALAVHKGVRAYDESWTYHSLVSNAFSQGAFIGTAVEEVTLPSEREDGTIRGVRVRVEGNAHYTGAHTFVFEEGDAVSAEGFDMKSVAARNV